MRRPRAPWRDCMGARIRAGDTLMHPDGDTFTAVWFSPGADPHRQWRAVYKDTMMLSLALQIGDKGRAKVIK